MKIIVHTAFLLFGFLCFSQLPSTIISETEKIDNFEDYYGSIYLTGRYKDASVVDEQVGAFDAKLKYNIFSDELEYKKDSKLYKVHKKPTLHARIGRDYFYYCEFESSRGINKEGYYILVELNDSYRIYKKYSVEIIDSTKATRLQANEPGKIKVIANYYIEESGVIVQLPTHKKDMLATFEDKKSELIQYMKQQRIKIRKESDLIRLVAKYNALKNIDSNPNRSLLTNVSRNFARP